MSKLLVMMLWLGSFGFSRFGAPFVPFVPLIDALRGAGWLQLAWTAVLIIGTVGITFNLFVRLSSFAIGTMLLFKILSSHLYYSNNSFLLACLFLLLGLSDKFVGGLWIRLQVVLVYAGAALNKLLDPDWQSGLFFEHWSTHILRLDWYVEASSLLPAMMLSQLMCWIVILTEMSLAIGFLLPALRSWACVLGVFFHGGVLVFTGGELSWVFFYLMCTSYLAFFSWPAEMLYVWWPKAADHQILRWTVKLLFPTVAFSSPWSGAAEDWMQLKCEDKITSNLSAMVNLLRYSAITYITAGLAILALWALVIRIRT